MGKIVLVTGGARSGKSVFAESLIMARGKRVVYVATAEAHDAEMEERIARHREQRPPTWTTREVPYDLSAALSGLEGTIDGVLVDCLAVWTSNRLLMLGEVGTHRWWDQVNALEITLAREAQSLVDRARGASWDLILVTNEVGFGVVPPTPLGRAFRDLLGRLNRTVAMEADAVFLVVTGLGLELKRLAVAPESWCG